MLLPICRRPLLAARSLNLRSGARSLSESMTSMGVPQSKTRVLLQNLPLTATEQVIRDAVADLNCRRVEIEPGCAVHFTSEVPAMHAKDAIAKMGCQAILKPATLPSMVLNNLNPSVTVEEITQTYGKFDPKLVRLLSSSSVQVTVSSAAEAVQVQAAVRKLTAGSNTLSAYSVMLPDGKAVVQVSNIPHGSDVEEVKRAVEAAAKTASTSATVSLTKAAAQSIKLRFSGNASATAVSEVMAKLANVELKGKKGSAVGSTATPFRIPALFLRNVECMSQADIEKDVLHGQKFDRVQVIMKSKDVGANLAVVYFASEADATKCFHDLRNKPKRNINGEKVHVAMKFTSEPAVKVTNLPEGATEEAVAAFFERYSVARVHRGDAAGEMLVVFATPRLAELAVEGMSKRVFEGQVINVTKHAHLDNGFEIQFADGLPSGASAKELADELQQKYSLSIPVKSLTTDTNISAVLGFDSVATVGQAQKHFNATMMEGSSRTKQVVHPAYVLEVTDYPTDKPVSELAEAVNAAAPDGDSSITRIDRSAVLKFKRNQDVVPGMKKLKSVDWIESNNVAVSRYQAAAPVATSSYDAKDDMDVFDDEMSKEFNTEYLYTNPATRYQVVKNSFERNLYDARIRQEAGILVNPLTTSAKLKNEVQQLLKAPATDDAAEKRLFEIYLQQQDLKKFTKGFEEMSLLFGDAAGVGHSNGAGGNDGNDEFSAEHPLHWSQFADANLPRDFQLIQEKLRALDKEALENPEVALGIKPAAKDSLFHKDQAKALLGANGLPVAVSEEDEDAKDAAGDELASTRFGRKKAALTISDDDDEEEDDSATINSDGSIGKEYSVYDEEGNKNTISLDDAQQLKDKTGFSWSGIVLDNDTTQKTMPGGRVMTHRCLVVVGNLRGTAGFGKGKGKNADDALSAAFRDALRNLLHVDLYDNYGLCHDVQGKHNACYSYIRHTSRERMMIASPFASEILLRFGISSVSCKMVGRRDPYAQVRAIFNALGKHMNIDEIAKLRGKRYFTLKHALENKV